MECIFRVAQNFPTPNLTALDTIIRKSLQCNEMKPRKLFPNDRIRSSLSHSLSLSRARARARQSQKLRQYSMLEMQYPNPYFHKDIPLQRLRFSNGWEQIVLSTSAPLLIECTSRPSAAKGCAPHRLVPPPAWRPATLCWATLQGQTF
jgi:hypothetical protein